MHHTSFRPTRLAAIAAAFVASASCYAGGGEALDIELPSMRSPVGMAVHTQSSVAQQEVALANTSRIAAASFGIAPTREQVRTHLKEARSAGTLSRHGEAGDTTDVLGARERFNSQQRDAIIGEYIADQERTTALAQAELRRSEIEAEGLVTEQLAREGRSMLPDGNVAAVADEAEVRIDAVKLDTTAAAKPNELVGSALGGGDEQAQRESPLAVRRELGELGLAPRPVDLESTGPAVHDTSTPAGK